MKIGIAGDHAGFEHKEQLLHRLIQEGHQVEDFGAFHYDPSDDYPDIILPLGNALAAGDIDKGIAICGSGVGVSIAANKIKGVRAALISDYYSAHQGVEHDDMNLLCLGGRVLGPVLIEDIVKAFLEADFQQEERFQRRLDKVLALENKWKTT